MPITSQLRPSPAFGEIWLERRARAGLLKPSAVKPVIATLEQRLVIRALGSLDASDKRMLGGALNAILGR